MYDIKMYRSKRPNTKYIILTHSINLIKPSIYINPVVNRSTYKLTWDLWLEYWYHDQMKLDVPCHYYVELLNKDYVVFTGLAMQKKSWYLEELANNNLIDDIYRDSLLVMIGENYIYDLPEDRLYKIIANRILSPMCYQYKINFSDRVLILDDILKPNYENILKNSRLEYDIKPMTKWNQDLFLAYSRPYMKLIQSDSLNNTSLIIPEKNNITYPKT